MTAWNFLRYLHNRVPAAGFFSTEKPCTRATNSELRRWLQNKSVLINEKRPDWKDVIEFPVWEMVLFPKAGMRRIVLASNDHPFILVKG